MSWSVTCLGSEDAADVPESVQVPASDAKNKSAFTAPSASVHSDKEQRFRDQIVKDFPDLCSDSLPLDGPSATLPDGTPYSVKLKLKHSVP